MCFLLVAAAQQGEALINDKINWLALFFAIYSVSGGGLAANQPCLQVHSNTICTAVVYITAQPAGLPLSWLRI